MPRARRCARWREARCYLKHNLAGTAKLCFKVLTAKSCFKPWPRRLAAGTRAARLHYCPSPARSACVATAIDSQDSPTGDGLGLPLCTIRDTRLQMAVRSACASEILVVMQGLGNPERDPNTQGCVRAPPRIFARYGSGFRTNIEPGTRNGAGQTMPILVMDRYPSNSMRSTRICEPL